MSMPGLGASHREPPRADPQAVRACLPVTLVAEFDGEWELVLDQAKLSKELAPIQQLLFKWQQIAAAELASPGIYERMYAKAEEITRTGRNATAASIDDMRAVIDRRLKR